MKHTVQSLFHMLAEKGKEFSDDKQGNNWEAVGRALASISGSTRDVMRLAYDFAEAGNNHAVCSLINWVFNIYEFKHKDDLQNIKGIFHNRQYLVNMTRNEDGSWTQKKYRAVITFEEVE